MPRSFQGTQSPPIRRLMWRLGRTLYMRARGELGNDMRTNGELRLQGLVLDVIPPAETAVVLDIGANLGAWTTAALNHRPHGAIHVHAFEPVPATRARLEANVAPLPRAADVTIVGRALSSTPGIATMEIGAGGGGTSTLGTLGPNGVGSVEVEVSTLDAFLAESGLDHVHLVKSDTEGFDLEVMRGARAALEGGRIDVWQFEYNHRWLFNRNALRDVFELIEALPYQLGRVQATGIELYDAWHPELDRFFEANYVLLHDRVRQRLGAVEGRIGTGNVWMPHTP